MTGLRTRWADDVDPVHPWPEHPRPQLVREGWLSLNGPWDHAVTSGPEPDRWDGPILVPFSPEAALSGVERAIGPDDVLWYRRSLPLAELPARPVGSRVLLHLGAVDQVCEVRADGVVVGAHVGGYLPVTCDLTAVVVAARAAGRDAVELVVRVTDDTDRSWHTRGKQRTERGGIWYTPQSGIWQTVWLEVVPRGGVDRLALTPHLAFHDGGVTASLEVLVVSTSPSAEVTVSDDTGVVAVATVSPGRPAFVPVARPRLWSPEHPHLYDVTVTCGDDRVTSYAGLRSVGVGPDADGVPRLLLNGTPYLHVGVLDQGYWPEGLLTAPTDEALRADVLAAKELGFTMVRKHIKVEPLRWYHHCDRLGLLVWQDMPSGGTDYRFPVVSLPAATPLRLPDRWHRLFGRGDAAGRAEFRDELAEMVEHLRSVPSIVAWVPFNEGWGQFDAAAIADDVRRLDPTRIVDHASGWHDQGADDVRSLHVYRRRFRMPRRRRGDRRPVVLSEYGGYNLRVEGHTWGEKDFGYQRAGSAAELLERFVRLHAREIAPAVGQGLSGTVYTQLTDVEDELNGLLTYDRVDKLDRSRVRSVLRALRW